MSVDTDAVTAPLTFISIDRIASKNAFFNSTDADSAEIAKPEVSTVTVNSVSIEPDEILAEAQHHPADTAEAALSLAARALVVRELLSQEAQRLCTNSIPEIDSSGRMETEQDAMIRVLIDQQVVVPEASVADCERFYQNHPEQFSSDTLYDVRHILLAAAADDKRKRESQKLLAESLIAQLALRPGKFGLLAKVHSDCTSREQGGHLGQITKGSTVREFEQALITAPIGTVTRTPVESRYGFHIVKVVRCVPGAVLPFNVVNDRIAAWLEASSWSRAVCQYVTLLAGQADINGIEINSAASPLVQ